MTLAVGDRVRHPTLHETWGPGEVLAVTPDGKVTVHFALAGQRTLKGVPLVKLEGDDAMHPLLDKRKKSARSAARPYTFSQRLQFFQQLFPAGFSDEKYLIQERNPKVGAGEKFRALLSRSEYELLLDARNFAEIVKRAFAVVNATTLIFPNEKMDLKDGVAVPRNQESFARSLYHLIYGDAQLQVRFDAFVDALEEMRALTWTTVTYLPFVACPAEHMFLKPGVTKQAAETCSFDLEYSPRPNWKTYQQLLTFTGTVKDLIKELEPRDNIDVQSFMFRALYIS